MMGTQTRAAACALMLATAIGGNAPAAPPSVNGASRRPTVQQLAAAEPRGWGVLRLEPNSKERIAPIEALQRQGTALAETFARRVHRNAKGEQMPYRLFTPARLESGRTYPLVVFLHGAGGSGADNALQLQGANVFGALAWALPEHQKRHPAFVLAPQTDVNWACTIFDPKNPPKTVADIKFCGPGELSIGARLAFEIIDSLLARLPIDPARIYVTGHSMGGAGTWHMIAERPRFFAAAVPVCGHPLPATAGTVKDVPIWNFHGVADAVEPVATSRVMIEALKRAGGHPRHTEYEAVGHNVFMWAYTEPALVEWLFEQKRPRPAVSPR
jgi:predicted peptidase